ncbi:MAG TPA: oxalurate catabolism protein HpxZ [Stellaceae bacterium]|nr:oxalurate catabolism protein HpxZ [Stellaceae bacterium]
MPTVAKELAVNLPEVHAEVAAAFYRYEEALNANDVAVLNELFRNAPYTLRYGIGEELYGHSQIAAFRSGRTPPGRRNTKNTVITTFGRDFATASTEFLRPGQPSLGRQQQSWVRFPEGWRIVAAHVSFSHRG